MLNHSGKYAQLTDEQFGAIGLFLVEWSNVDVLLRMVLSRLLLTPAFLARTYTDEISSQGIDRAIREAVEIHRYRYGTSLIGEPILKQIIDACEQAAQARGLRNKIAHFCWMRSTDQELFGTRFSGGIPGSSKHRKGDATIKVSELLQRGQDAYALADKITKLLEELPELEEGEELGALIRKSHVSRPTKRGGTVSG